MWIAAPVAASGASIAATADDRWRAAASAELPPDQRFQLDLADIAEVWRRGSVIGSWLLDLTAMALAEDPKLDQYSGFVEKGAGPSWPPSRKPCRRTCFRPRSTHASARARRPASPTAVIGISRAEKDDETFRRDLGIGLRRFGGCKVAQDGWNWLAERISYLQGDFDDPSTYKNLAQFLAAIEGRYHTGGSVLFYLATPPQVFATIVHRLGNVSLVGEADGQWRRVIIEKPFGTDLRSAQALNREILGVLNESQIYRIDHYLGKETIQNIMVFRFANGIFEPLWNRNHIDHVQITVAEALDVEGRGKFYDVTGALRDMVPNHLFQLLTLTAMEPPTCFGAGAVRTEKTKVLEAIRPFAPGHARRNIVRGQYGAGAVAGRPVEPYRRAANVAPQSMTETYVALKLAIDNWRWAGVPFYLRTGKALAARRTEW
jgi:glucose-6-phosphate 1-dehydrogenase